MKIIDQYFPEINSLQREQFSMLFDLYKEWNSKINVISRKDIDNFEIHHLLHSLSLAKIFQFKKDTNILDVGTGGGFPGIPLAIMFPEISFTLIDSIEKKIKVVANVASSIGLKNITTLHTRVENIISKYDFIVSRAVTSFPEFVKITKHCILKDNKNNFPNGLIYLKGGDFDEEIKSFKNKISIYNISDFFEEEFFETKKIIYLPL